MPLKEKEKLIMGTNYYHRINHCTECGRFDSLHIGKASAGWPFSFRGYTSGEYVIKSYQDWIKHLEQGGEIYNEYGGLITLKDFEKLVKSKIDATYHRTDFPADSWEDNWTDENGHSFSGNEFC